MIRVSAYSAVIAVLISLCAAAAPESINYQGYLMQDGVAMSPREQVSSMSYSVNAWAPDTTTPFEKRLEAGWNQIGAPFNHATAWSQYRFKRDGDASAVSMATAIASSWIDSNSYSYTGSGYQAHDSSQPLEPFTGYFVYAQTAGTLILNPGAGREGGPARPVRKAYDWKLRIVAEPTNARDTENFIGILNGAAEAFGR